MKSREQTQFTRFFCWGLWFIIAIALLVTFSLSCSAVKTADVNITVTWTAVADDGFDLSSGACELYDMRYAIDSMDLINDWNNQSTFSNMSQPSIMGVLDFHSEIIYLQTGVNYYLAIKAGDEIQPETGVRNWSDISNIHIFYVPDTFKPGKINDLRVNL